MISRCCLMRMLSAALLCLLLPSGAGADMLEMKNGDRLSGEVVKFEKGVVILKTTYAPKIEIQATAVSAMHMDQPMELRLKDGGQLQGRVSAEGEAVRVSAQGSSEPIELPWPSVASMTRVASVAVWSGNLYAGALQQSGNTELMRLNIGGDFLRKSRARRLSMSLQYNYAEEGSSVSSRDFYGSIRYDRFVSRWFFSYMHGEVFMDPFKDLNLRLILGPGFGYQFSDDDDFYCSLGAGLSWMYEDRKQEEDSQGGRARVGAELRYQVSEGLHLAEVFAFYPSSLHGGDYSLRNEVSLISRIYGPWSLRLSNLFERERDPSPGQSRHDIKSSLNLQYSF